jgi:hypothetical protein
LHTPYSKEKASGIGSGIIGQTMLDAVSFQFVGVRSDDDLVAANLGSYNLGDDVLVGEANPVRLSQTLFFNSNVPYRTTRRYFGALYLFLACETKRFRA